MCYLTSNFHKIQLVCRLSGQSISSSAKIFCAISLDLVFFHWEQLKLRFNLPQADKDDTIKQVLRVSGHFEIQCYSEYNLNAHNKSTPGRKYDLMIACSSFYHLLNSQLLYHMALGSFCDWYDLIKQTSRPSLKCTAVNTLP